MKHLRTGDPSVARRDPHARFSGIGTETGRPANRGLRPEGHVARPGYRSEERRVGKECRATWSADRSTTKTHKALQRVPSITTNADRALREVLMPDTRDYTDTRDPSAF